MMLGREDRKANGSEKALRDSTSNANSWLCQHDTSDVKTFCVKNGNPVQDEGGAVGIGALSRGGVLGYSSLIGG